MKNVPFINCLAGLLLVAATTQTIAATSLRITINNKSQIPGFVLLGGFSAVKVNVPCLTSGGGCTLSKDGAISFTITPADPPKLGPFSIFISLSPTNSQDTGGAEIRFAPCKDNNRAYCSIAKVSTGNKIQISGYHQNESLKSNITYTVYGF